MEIISLVGGGKKRYKISLKIPNSEIYKKYTCGVTIDELAQEYYLSEKSIIISQENHLYS